MALLLPWITQFTFATLRRLLLQQAPQCHRKSHQCQTHRLNLRFSTVPLTSVITPALLALMEAADPPVQEALELLHVREARCHFRAPGEAAC